MRHPVNWLLRVGRSDADRLSLQGDLDEEWAARMARGKGRLTTFCWYTKEVLSALAFAVWDGRRPLRLALIGDVRYALRRWRHRPGFSATAILTLGLGIAAATSIFSVVDAVLLKPLPWTSPESLVIVHGVYPDRRGNPATAATWDRWYLSYPAWDALQTSSAFEVVGAWRYVPLANTTFGEGRTEIVTALEVSSNFLPMLGVKLSLGRYFNDNEDHSDSESLILTYETWQRRFGGRQDVIGERVMMGAADSGDRLPKTIIGVLAPVFRFAGIQPDVLEPIGIPARAFRRYPSPALRAVARLAPGVSLSSAESQTSALVSAAPNDQQGSARLVRLEDEQLGASRRPLWLLFGGAGILLLVACSNVAGLLLGEARLRRHEFAVRAALGGSRARVFRQLVVEHALLAVAASAVGLIVAYWLTGVLVTMAPAGMPRIEGTTIDLRAAVFALATGLVTLLTFGVAPALSLARTSVAAALAEGGRQGGVSSVIGQRLIVGAQVAMALVLLSGAMLFGETMLKLHAQPLGFDPDRVAVVSTTFTGDQFGDPGMVRQALAAAKAAGQGSILQELRTTAATARSDALFERIASIPGVTGMAAASAVPFVTNPARGRIVLPEQPGAEPYDVLRQTVTRLYFSTMGIAFRGGRGFDSADSGGTRVAIVSSEFERRFFPGGAIDREFKEVYGDPNQLLSTAYRVVGVVADVKRQEPTDDERPAFYVYDRQGGATNHLVIRTAGDPVELFSALRQAISQVSPQIVVTSMMTLESKVVQSVVEERFRATLSSIFGAAALMLAAVGLYGLAARRVADRQREFGVRVALGARPSDVRRLVLRDAMLIVSMGLAVGLPASFATAQITRSLLFGVTPTAPHVFAVTGLVLAVVVMAAAIVPARRAGRVDPVLALKQ